MMLVRDLLNRMHPTQVVTVCVQTLNSEDKPTTYFERKTLGKVRKLQIPEDVLNREVNYYTIESNIVTNKGKEENFEDLPYIELELVFNISVYQGGKKNEFNRFRH